MTAEQIFARLTQGGLCKLYTNRMQNAKLTCQFQPSIIHFG